MFSGGIFKERCPGQPGLCAEKSARESAKVYKKERKQVEARFEYYIQSKQQ